MYKVFVLVLAFGSYSLADPVPQDKYVRPCHGHVTPNCVRNNLAGNSRCNPRVQGSIPNEYRGAPFRFEAPYFNASYIDEDQVIKNHDKCYVADFYYNLDADTAVLQVDCPYLTIQSNRTLIQHYTGAEDVVYSFDSHWEYPLVRLTANIQNANEMDLCSSFVFSDVVDLPNFILSPNDVQTEEFLSTDLSFMNIYERENWFYRGPVIFHQFVKAVLCDFGC